MRVNLTLTWYANWGGETGRELKPMDGLLESRAKERGTKRSYPGAPLRHGPRIVRPPAWVPHPSFKLAPWSAPHKAGGPDAHGRRHTYHTTILQLQCFLYIIGHASLVQTLLLLFLNTNNQKSRVPGGKQTVTALHHLPNKMGNADPFQHSVCKSKLLRMVQ